MVVPSTALEQLRLCLVPDGRGKGHQGRLKTLPGLGLRCCGRTERCGGCLATPVVRVDKGVDRVC